MATVAERDKPTQEMTAEQWLTIIHQQTVDAATKPPPTPAEIIHQAEEDAKDWTAIGRPAMVNRFSQVVNDIRPSTVVVSPNSPISSCPTGQTTPGETRPITPATCTSDEALGKLHYGFQKRWSGARDKEAIKDRRRHVRELQREGIIPNQTDRKTVFYVAVEPTAKEAQDAAGITTILQENEMSAATVAKIAEKLPLFGLIAQSSEAQKRFTERQYNANYLNRLRRDRKERKERARINPQAKLFQT